MNNVENWRERIKEIGKEGYEIEELRKLGFLDITQTELDDIIDNEKTYRKLLKRIDEINKQLDGLADITPYIEKIRARRIERVKAERIVKKQQKAEAEKLRKEKIAESQRKQPLFLGDTISKGLNYKENEKDRRNELQLPLCNNLDELQILSGIDAKQWQWLAYHKRVADRDHYNRFEIPKKSGGMRRISAPKKQLHEAQQWIKTAILDQIELHDAAMAFRPKRSIVDNAKVHHQGEVVIRIDFKDFFPSISYNRVKGIFKSFGYNEAISSILASVCTDADRRKAVINDKTWFVALGEKCIPQGAATSPALTNILCIGLDRRLEGLAKKNGFVYTRYADDIIFSSTSKETNVKSFLSWVKRIIKEEGLQINEDKTRVMRNHQRQSVTGIIVNDKEELRISRKDIRRFHSFLHRLFKDGENASRDRIGKDPYLYLAGYLSFVQMVNPQQAHDLRLYMSKMMDKFA